MIEVEQLIVCSQHARHSSCHKHSLHLQDYIVVQSMHNLFCKELILAVPCILHLLSLHENFQNHNNQQVNCQALWLNHSVLVHLNVIIKKIVTVMNMNNLTPPPCITIMMWDVSMQLYSNTLELCVCNYMYGTTDNRQ